MKHTLMNGWTKKKMKQTILDRNTGTRCMSPEESSNCAYSDGKGNHCAVGCFIPDDHGGMGSPDGAAGLLRNYPELKELMPLDEDGLSLLQHCHDTRGAFGVRDRMFDWIDNNVVEPKGEREMKKLIDHAMTCAKLIELLSEYPPDTIVQVEWPHAYDGSVARFDPDPKLNEDVVVL